MLLQSKIDFQPQDTPQDILAKILVDRGLTTSQQQADFLHPPKPTRKTLANALGISLKDLSQFKHLIQQAKEEQQQVCIFGDYDADGLTSTAILWQALTKFGLDVLPFIPHRQKHGYGLSAKAIQEITSGQAFNRPFKPKLIITTDTGIVAHQEIDQLRHQGYQVILTDHHQANDQLPPANLIIHSTKTAAAGIAFLLAQEILGDQAAWPLLELATIGIIADQIPLTQINRNLVFHGLKLLQQPTNPGLQALYQQVGFKPDQLIDTYTVGFILAPRLNATGRLSHALDSLRLLCSSDLITNQRLAQVLDSTNQQRQDLTYSAYQQALNQLDDSPLIIIASPDFHEGIIGLVAGKIVQLTHKPAIVISYDQTLAKGSARSVSGFNITQFLRQYQDDLLSVGGHALAAGFSLDPSNLDTFINKIKEDVSQSSLLKSLPPKQLIFEGQLSLTQLNLELYQLLQQLQPFGLGNPKPLFLTQAQVKSFKFMGQKSQHLKLYLESDHYSLPAVWFNTPPDLQPNQLSQFIFELNLNTWRQQTNLQLIIRHAF